MTFEDLSGHIAALLADPARTILPQAHELRVSLLDAGAAPVMEALGARLASGQDVDPVFAADRLRHVALASVLEHLQGSDAALGRETGQITADAEIFGAADRFHISANPARVARKAAERARLQLNAVPQQRLAVQDQARRKRTFKSLRQLMAEAPEALLALKPCWAMSPLLVSRYLPAQAGMFDLIVFDEASQVLVPDAVPSILRGGQAVVAGDDKQLPPTTVFTKMLDADYDPAADSPGGPGAADGQAEEDGQLASEISLPAPADATTPSHPATRASSPRSACCCPAGRCYGITAAATSASSPSATPRSTAAPWSPSPARLPPRCWSTSSCLPAKASVSITSPRPVRSPPSPNWSSPTPAPSSTFPKTSACRSA